MPNRVAYHDDDDFVNSPINDALDENQPKTELLKPSGAVIALLLAGLFTFALVFVKMSMNSFAEESQQSANYLIIALLASILAFLSLLAILTYGLVTYHRDSFTMKMLMFMCVFCLAFADLSMVVVAVFGFRAVDMILPLVMLMISAGFQRLLYETRRRGWIFLHQRNIRMLSSFTTVLLWWWVVSANFAIVLSVWDMVLEWLRVWLHYLFKRYSNSS